MLLSSLIPLLSSHFLPLLSLLLSPPLPTSVQGAAKDPMLDPRRMRRILAGALPLTSSCLLCLLLADVCVCVFVCVCVCVCV